MPPHFAPSCRLLPQDCLGLRVSTNERPRDLGAIFDSVEYRFWRNLRDSDDSRYLVLTMPRALARLPYSDSALPVREFPFQEMLDQRQASMTTTVG